MPFNSAVVQASELQGYVGASAVEQASAFQGYVEVNDVAAVDSRDSSGTLDYTRNDTAGTVIDPGTVNFTQPLAPNGTTPSKTHARRRSRSPRLHEEEQESFGLTSVHLSHPSVFHDACWRCGGWSAGSRRASRLKDPCGFPSKTGADVVYRVSGGYPPKAHVWRSDDASGAPERIPIIKNP